VRCALPPTHRLPTQERREEFYLPPADKLDKDGAHTWVLAHVEAFADTVVPSLAPTCVEALYVKHAARFENGFCDNADNILIWFSGKNLMAALRDWWSGLGMAAGPGDFRNHIRDWMRDHPEDVLNALPEWRGLLDAMRQR